MNRRITVRVFASLLLCWCALSPAGAFDSGRSAFTATVGGREVGYRRLFFTALPGETVRIAVPAAGRYELSGDTGTVKRDGETAWRWTAPGSPGHGTLTVTRGDGEAMALAVFVMRPYAEMQGGTLNGYRIGEYPPNPLRNDPIYLAPPGFIEVTADMMDLPVSPHFTLGQFLCKQQPEHWPKYLALRPVLLVKLEAILEAANAAGIHTDRFVVMSGYRTPVYNRALGNVAFSRHLWGGAADIYVDNDGDGVMDDLNGDGALDYRDAVVLKQVVERLAGGGLLHWLLGGLGVYGPRVHHGAFVHVDARGRKARWESP